MKLKDHLLRLESELEISTNYSSNVLQRYKEYETILKSNGSKHKQRGSRYDQALQQIHN